MQHPVYTMLTHKSMPLYLSFFLKTNLIYSKMMSLRISKVTYLM